MTPTTLLRGAILGALLAISLPTLARAQADYANHLFGTHVEMNDSGDIVVMSPGSDFRQLGNIYIGCGGGALQPLNVFSLGLSGLNDGLIVLRDKTLLVVQRDGSIHRFSQVEICNGSTTATIVPPTNRASAREFAAGTGASAPPPSLMPIILEAGSGSDELFVAIPLRSGSTSRAWLIDVATGSNRTNISAIGNDSILGMKPNRTVETEFVFYSNQSDVYFVEITDTDGLAQIGRYAVSSPITGQRLNAIDFKGEYALGMFRSSGADLGDAVLIHTDGSIFPLGISDEVPDPSLGDCAPRVMGSTVDDVYIDGSISTGSRITGSFVALDYGNAGPTCAGLYSFDTSADVAIGDGVATLDAVIEFGNDNSTAIATDFAFNGSQIAIGVARYERTGSEVTGGTQAGAVMLYNNILID